MPKAFPARVEADVEAARAFVQDIFTIPKVDTAPRDADFNFKKIPLWKFVVMAIGAAIAGDVDIKLMYAMIGQRNSAKGMLMSDVAAAFVILVDMGKSANNLLGTTTTTTRPRRSCCLRMRSFAARTFVEPTRSELCPPGGRRTLTASLSRK